MKRIGVIAVFAGAVAAVGVTLNRRTPTQAAPKPPSKEDVQADSCVQLLHQWQYRPAPAKGP